MWTDITRKQFASSELLLLSDVTEAEWPFDKLIPTCDDPDP